MTEVLIWITTIIGSCALIGKALVPIAALTATKKDDAIVGKINSAIEFVKKYTDKIGLNN